MPRARARKWDGTRSTDFQGKFFAYVIRYTKTIFLHNFSSTMTNYWMVEEEAQTNKCSITYNMVSTYWPEEKNSQWSLDFRIALVPPTHALKPALYTVGVSSVVYWTQVLSYCSISNKWFKEFRFFLKRIFIMYCCVCMFKTSDLNQNKADANSATYNQKYTLF